MNAGDKVAALEALLARVKKNADLDRPEPRRAVSTSPGVPPLPSPPSSRPSHAGAISSTPAPAGTLKGTGRAAPSPAPPSDGLPKVPKVSSLKVEIPPGAGYEDPFAEGWDLDEPAPPKDITPPTPPPPAKPSDPGLLGGLAVPPGGRARTKTPTRGSALPAVSPPPRSARSIPKPLRSTFSSRSSASFAAVRPSVGEPPTTRLMDRAPGEPVQAPAPAPTPGSPSAPQPSSGGAPDTARTDLASTLVSEVPGPPADRPVHVELEPPREEPEPAPAEAPDLAVTLASPDLGPPPPPPPAVPFPEPKAPPRDEPLRGLGSTLILEENEPTEERAPAISAPLNDDGGVADPGEPGTAEASTGEPTAEEPHAARESPVPPPLEPALPAAEAAAQDNPWAREAARSRTAEPPKGRSWVWLGVALTALLVGIAFFAYQRATTKRADPLPPTGSAAARPPTALPTSARTSTEPRGSVEDRPRPDSSVAAPTPTAVATTSPTGEPGATATATPTAAPTAAPPPGDPKSLPSDAGYLTVLANQPGRVFVFGRELGLAGQPLEVKCGTVNVRIAKPGGPDDAIEWLSAGEPVVVACQSSTEVTVSVSR